MENKERYKNLVPQTYNNFIKWRETYNFYLWEIYIDLLKILKVYKVENSHKIKFDDFVKFAYQTSSKQII